MALASVSRSLPLLGPLLILSACGVHHSARPLDKGEHRVGATFGGPMVAFGGAVIPLPNLVVQGASGVAELNDKPLELDYGLNVTALAFGQLGLHLGGSYLLLEQKGAIPALSVTDRIYIYNNYISPTTTPEAKGFSFVDQLEVTASWLVKEQLIYGGLAQYTDLKSPGLILSPFMGLDLSHGSGPWSVQIEGRYMGVNLSKEVNTIEWVGVGDRGAVAFNLGFSRTFGEGK